MEQIFALNLKAKLPEEGFSLDELVIETKRIFESEGMPGFLRALLRLYDQLVYMPGLGANENKNRCCNSSYLVVAQTEEKSIATGVGQLKLLWTRLRCSACGKSTIPLRSYLGL